MNKKILLLFSLCSFAGTIFSGYYPSKRVGSNWPEEVKDWKIHFIAPETTVEYVDQDDSGRHIAKVTTERGLTYSFYLYKELNGELGQTVRPSGWNKEIPCFRVFDRDHPFPLFLLPEQARLFKKFEGMGGVQDPLETMPIEHDGTGIAPDQDESTIKPKLKSTVEPRLSKLFDEGMAILDKKYKEEAEIIDNIILDDEEENSKEINAAEPTSDLGANSLEGTTFFGSLYDIRGYMLPAIGAITFISVVSYLMHCIVQGHYYLSRNSLWSSWKSEEPFEVLLSLKPKSIASALIKDINLRYSFEENPLACFLQDIEKEEAEIESWLIFRDKLSAMHILLPAVYDSAGMRLALLSHMREAVYGWRSNQLSSTLNIT